MNNSVRIIDVEKKRLLKAFKLLASWALDCNFNYNLSNKFQKYRDKISGLDSIDALMWIAYWESGE